MKPGTHEAGADCARVPGFPLPWAPTKVRTMPDLAPPRGHARAPEEAPSDALYSAWRVPGTRQKDLRFCEKLCYYVWTTLKIHTWHLPNIPPLFARSYASSCSLKRVKNDKHVAPGTGPQRARRPSAGVASRHLAPLRGFLCIITFKVDCSFTITCLCWIVQSVFKQPITETSISMKT